MSHLYEWSHTKGFTHTSDVKPLKPLVQYNKQCHVKLILTQGLIQGPYCQQHHVKEWIFKWFHLNDDKDSTIVSIPGGTTATVETK